MELKFIIQTIIEIAGILLLLCGFWHEDKLIAFEERLRDKIKTALAGSNSSDGRSKNLNDMITRKENKVK